MKIDLYDFDKTVYPADSTMAFWLFCLPRYPWIALWLPAQAVLLLLWGLHLLPTGRFKSAFLRFVTLIPTGTAVSRFWDRQEKKIYPWFQKEARARYTVVISASPDYLLREICGRLQVDKLICTKGDARTGKLLSANCKGEEKVRRLYAELSGFTVEAVYSDSIDSDAPMLALGAQKVHTVKGARYLI